MPTAWSVERPRAHAELVHDEPGDGVPLAGAVDEADGRAPGQRGERDVVPDGQWQEQALGLAVLGHVRDAEAGPDRVLRSPQPDRPAVDLEVAAGGPLGAEQGQEQVPLALSGEPADAQNLAPTQFERDSVEATAPQVPDPQGGVRPGRWSGRPGRYPRTSARSSG